MLRCLPIFLFICLQSYAQRVLYDRQFFVNSMMPGNYFYSEANYTSPSWIKNINRKLPVDDKIFFTPGNALQLDYISADKGEWNAVITYHDIRGIDAFTNATQLVFRLFIESNTKNDALPLITLAKDSSTISSFLPIQNYISAYTTGKWIKVSIPLKDFGDKISFADINSVQFKQQAADNNEHVLYIDQLELLPDIKPASSFPPPALISAKAYAKHIDIVWKPVADSTIKYIKIFRSTDGKSFYPVGIQTPWINRYADYTGATGKKFYYKINLLNDNYEESSFSNTLPATTHEMSDAALLDMVQEANFRYYWEGAESNSGLALEDIPGRHHMIASGATGFGIMALIAGAERKFISRSQAVDRFDKITSFLMSAEKFHGAFAHFIDGETGKVVPFFGDRDNGGDLVETAFLMQGLLCARQYFNANTKEEITIRSRIDTLWRGVEWDWYKQTPDSKFLYWHWSPDKAWIINHRLIGWNETMIIYILGICSPTHAIPASMYYSGWASQDEFAQHYRGSWGQTKEGDHYTNDNTYYGIKLKVGVSDGGPLFFTHYSFMGLDPHYMKDAYTDYFTNNKNIAGINYRYCIENPLKRQGYGADAWGLTASDGPYDYAADEPVLHADHGKITPTGALSSFPYLPNESMAALKNYYNNYGKFLWGAYGFYDSFNLDENWCSEIFMGLNQAPITVMIENYRSGLLWKLFMSCPEVKSGLQKLSSESPVK
ncbi:MAG TPA: glycan-binding surface protein [Parafilimonas sp.]|nr:glycan-binding surface protein [Parafilimonas sp.]